MSNNGSNDGKPNQREFFKQGKSVGIIQDNRGQQRGGYRTNNQLYKGEANIDALRNISSTQLQQQFGERIDTNASNEIYQQMKKSIQHGNKLKSANNNTNNSQSLFKGSNMASSSPYNTTQTDYQPQTEHNRQRYTALIAFTQNELTTIYYYLSIDMAEIIQTYEDRNAIKVEYLNKAFGEIKSCGLMFVLTVLLIIVDILII